MSRRLGDLAPDERDRIVAAIHAEAQVVGWHLLNNNQKGRFYDRWAAEFDLARPVVKDGIMKGFDVAQGIPASGEAAVHEEMLGVLRRSSVPYVASKVAMWNGRAQADFVIGYNAGFLTHAIELEPAPSWRDGLSQALWYKSAYYQESGIQAIPSIVLFGDVSAQRWDEIRTTCLDQRAQVAGFNLFVDGSPANPSLMSLLHLGRR